MSSLIQCLFKNMLFNFHIIVNFLVFLLLMILDFILLYWRRYFLWFQLCHIYWVLFCDLIYNSENVPYTLEKKVYSVVTGWSFLHLSERCSLFIPSLKFPISSLIFYLVLYIIEILVPKSPTFNVELCVSSSILSIFALNILGLHT